AAALLRRGWFHLFGSVLFYDVIRMARRSRYILLRCLYAGGLAVVLYWLYYRTFVAPAFLPRPPRPLVLPGPGSPGAMWNFQTPNRVLLTIFAEQFFNWFMILQFILVFLLTPVYAASCIAEEKERHTLEYLFATDLSDREIV